jgi:hypothetical protein
MTLIYGAADDQRGGSHPEDVISRATFGTMKSPAHAIDHKPAAEINEKQQCAESRSQKELAPTPVVARRWSAMFASLRASTQSLLSAR